MLSDRLRSSHIHACSQALTGNDINLDLGEAAAQAAQLQPIAVSGEALEGVLEFVTRRLEQLLVDEGCGIEVIKAVLSERGANPTIAAQSARELQVGSRTPHLTCRQHLVHVGCSCSTLPAWRRHGSKCIVAFRWLMSIFHICAFLLCECWMAARRYLLCCPCCCSSRKRSGQHVLQPT